MSEIIIVTLVTVEIFQVTALFIIVAFNFDEDLEIIKSKKDFLVFFIPFFWVILLLKFIIRYWKNLT
jgi:hypothetical protein